MSDRISESWVEASTSHSDSSREASPDPAPSTSTRGTRDTYSTQSYSPNIESPEPQHETLRSSQTSFTNQSQHSVRSTKPTRRTGSSSRRPAILPTTSSYELIMPKLDRDTLEASSTSHTKSTKSPRKTSTRRREPAEQAPKTNITQPSTGSRSSYRNDPIEAIFGHMGTMLSHILGIVVRSLRLLETPLSIALAAFLLLQIGLTTRNFLVSSIYSSVSPICVIPGVSLLNLPFCPAGGQNKVEPQGTAEFEQLMNVQSKFEDVLRETAIGITLPVDMKRSEASIRDLRQLVKYSHLRSRQELELEFDGFITTARQASFDLQKFNSHVGRSVDQVLSTTRWTLRVLDDISHRDTSTGSLSRFIRPFKPKPQLAEHALLDQYIKHSSSIEEQLHSLISEALILQMLLANLEDRLEIIHSIVLRENAQITSSRAEILSHLWTLVGGNRKSLEKMEGQLGLLGRVDTYRSTAYAHVSGTILRLQEISTGIEDLRERVGAPGVVRGKGDVPLEVHLESIRLGVERLEGSREIEKRNEVGNLGRRVGGEVGRGIEG